jgi:integrase
MMKTTPQRHRQEGLPGQTDRLVARISEANRPFALEGVQYRRNKGLRPGSILAWTKAVHRADQILGGKRFQDASPQELAGIITGLRAAKLGERTVYQYAVQLRVAWKDLLNVDDLPRNVKRALEVRQPTDLPGGRLVTDADFRLLLEQAAQVPGRKGRLYHATLWVAMLWALWDTGFRAEELLGLNIGDVTFEPGGAHIKLRPDAPNLKTGPRTIYVTECLGPLTALLEAHPQGDDAKAPLFPAMRNRREDSRLPYEGLQRFIKKLGEESGVNASSSWDKTLTPHDFRHSCATRKARAGWNEAQLRAFFGWKAGSKMASHYVHLTVSDVRDQVRRDAGIDDLGYSQAVEAGNDELALASLLQRILAKGKMEAGLTPGAAHLLAQPPTLANRARSQGPK